MATTSTIDAKKQLIDEAQEIVKRLVEVKFKLAENECEFVLQIEARLGGYGYGAFVSDKQMNWLRILDKKYAVDERQMSLLS